MDTVKTDTNAPRLTNGDVLELVGRIEKRLEDMDDSFRCLNAHDKSVLHRAIKSNIGAISELIDEVRLKIFRMD